MIKTDKQSKTAKKPLHIWVDYTTTETGGEATSPGERWSNHEDIEITATFIRLHRTQPNFWAHSIEINNADLLKLDRLWLAVVRYQTGGTFGRSHGNVALIGVAPTYHIAEEMLKEATRPLNKGERQYRPWEGYFERLEDTEIHELTLV